MLFTASAALTGCRGEQMTPVRPTLKVTLLHQEPGGSKGRPNGENVAASVWFEANGQWPKIGVDGDVTYENGKTLPLEQVGEEGSTALFEIPRIYDQRPKSVTVELREGGIENVKLGRFTVDRLAEPNYAIAPSEPFSPNPRWRVRHLDSTSISITPKAIPPGSMRRLKLLRTTHLDYRGTNLPQNEVALSPHISMRCIDMNARQIELEEIPTRVAHSTISIEIVGAKIDQVTGKPGSIISQAASGSFPNGNTISIPAQAVRLTHDRSTGAAILTVRANVLNWQYVAGPSLRLESVEPPLAKYGISTLRMQCSEVGLLGSKAFENAGPVQLGALPPIKLVFSSTQIIDTGPGVKQIVRVER